MPALHCTQPEAVEDTAADPGLQILHALDPMLGVYVPTLQV